MCSSWLSFVSAGSVPFDFSLPHFYQVTAVPIVFIPESRRENIEQVAIPEISPFNIVSHHLQHVPISDLVRPQKMLFELLFKFQLSNLI